MKIEPYLQTDFYKISHVQFFDKDCELIYSNFTPRKSLSANNDVVFFGLQYLIKEYLINQWNEGFFNRPKDEVIGHYKNFTEKTVGAVPWQHFAELHDIGYLPLVIKAVPEGTVIKTGTPAITLYNTDKRCFWLTNYLESIISCELWKACTSATTSRLLKKVCEKFADETCDNHNHIMFQNHDFSFRGMSGLQDAAISGAGHLLSSYGTDTIPAIRFLENYYRADINKELVGCSVPASEHSCSTVKGPEGEFDFIKRAITKEYPNGIVSIVSDSYDYFKVIKEYSLNLKEEILNRGPLNGIHPKVVFRPDSGDMVEILCGNPNSSDELERKGTFRILWENFGGTTNNKGYKELNPYVGCIWGDGLNLDRVTNLLGKIKDIGFASNNLVQGIGSWNYQMVSRDSYGWACKCTYAEVGGKSYDVCKDPKTDSNKLKKSHKGLLRLNEDMSLDQQVTWQEEAEGILEPVFYNGELVREQSLSEIRELLATQ